ncbi:MAG: CDP-archaeol synthase [Clostridia bacterium]|nr:CDP-archaeol synthase [Clostridia bacterium]
MLVRVLTGFCLTVIMVPVVFFAPGWGVSLMIAAFAGIAAFELINCVGHKKKWWVTVPAALFCAAAAAIHPGMFPDGIDAAAVLERVFVACVLLLILLHGLSAVVLHEHFPANDVMAQCGLCLYAAFGFGTLCRLSDTPHRALMVAAIVIPWVADSLAYFAGRAFGKRKLCPVISPKKTVEGAVGGVLGTAVIATVLYGILMKTWRPLSLAVVFAAAVILSVFSIFGDLFASVVKRHYQIKDYGKLLPGHGGIMDRFDSVLPVAVLLFLLYQIPFFAELWS